jgi:hypothetical protein
VNRGEGELGAGEKDDKRQSLSGDRFGPEMAVRVFPVGGFGDDPGGKKSNAGGNDIGGAVDSVPQYSKTSRSNPRDYLQEGQQQIPDDCDPRNKLDASCPFSIQSDALLLRPSPTQCSC